MFKISYIILIAGLLSLTCGSPDRTPGLSKLKISENRRFLTDENNNPFFWLGDTGWLLFCKLDRTDNDIRRYAYWSVFTGACGHTYGHNAVMQMHKPGDTDGNYGVKDFWFDAINHSGANQMIHLKNLMLSRPYFERVPDQSLIYGNKGDKYNYQVATRGTNYAFIYTYNARNVKVNMGKISGEQVIASWFNPRYGGFTKIGTFRNRVIA